MSISFAILNDDDADYMELYHGGGDELGTLGVMWIRELWDDFHDGG